MPTMYSLWRASTIVFVLQLAIGLSLFVETGNASESAVFVGAVTLLIVSGLLGDDVARLIDDDIQMVSVPAITAMGIVPFLTGPDMSFLNITGVIISSVFTIFLASLIALVVTHGRKGSMLMCFIAVLPLGLSTIIVGPILLFQHLHKTSNEPIA